MSKSSVLTTFDCDNHTVYSGKEQIDKSIQPNRLLTVQRLPASTSTFSVSTFTALLCLYFALPQCTLFLLLALTLLTTTATKQ